MILNPSELDHSVLSSKGLWKLLSMTYHLLVNGRKTPITIYATTFIHKFCAINRLLFLFYEVRIKSLFLYS